MSEDGAGGDGVLDPDEIDVRDSERVSELGENRYFVSVSDDESRDTTESVATDPGAEPGTADPARSTRSGESTLQDALAATDGTYAIAAAARTDGGVAEHAVGSDNVAETFEAFCRWYAGRIADDRTPPEDVLGVLLRESDLDL